MMFTFLTHAYDNSAKVKNFELLNQSGQTVSLSQFKGKIVVLEWYNKDCPFVRKHYESKNMQGLQAKYTAQNVTWLTVISSAKGKQGHLNALQAKDQMALEGMKSNHVLIDEQGLVGKAFDAKTTPHMFILDQHQNLVYQGAIDSIASVDLNDIKKATPYFENAIKELLNSKKISLAFTKAYGCSVKY